MMYKITKVTAEYEEEFGTYPTKEEISDLLGVSVDTIDAVIGCSKTPISIDKTVRYGNADSSRTLKDIIPDESESVDEALDRQKVVEVIRLALGTLSEREEKIMRLRFGISEPETSSERFPISKAAYVQLNQAGEK
tara:strand:- start:301 stop:708 length:408 start_codon:yes stop_codon:yes gene_type:complete